MTWLDLLLSLLTIGGVLAIVWASTVWPEVRDVAEQGEEE